MNRQSFKMNRNHSCEIDNKLAFHFAGSKQRKMTRLRCFGVSCVSYAILVLFFFCSLESSINNHNYFSTAFNNKSLNKLLCTNGSCLRRKKKFSPSAFAQINYHANTKFPHQNPRKFNEAKLDAIPLDDENEYEINKSEKNFAQNNLKNSEKSSITEGSSSTIPMFNALNEKLWDYKFHGNDWISGKCKTGKRQSPVDLHIGNLPEPNYKNLTKLFFAAFGDKKEGEIPKPFKPWKKGDFFFSYTNLMREVQVYKSNKVFQIQAPKGGLTPLGALFATDTPEMFVADQIFFHSPSEHTFQGTGNRRQIEMQIWHYSSDLLSLKATMDTNTLKFPYFTLFTQGSLGEKDVIDELMKQRGSVNDLENINGHWRVVSLTFMSEELDKTTESELQELPSEKFISSILSATSTRPQDKFGGGGIVALEKPMNLPSLMLMLQLTNTEFFAYDGSTTMPQCTENVRWYVARQPLPVATETMLRELQNVSPNENNAGEVFLVQGFPMQVLIGSTLGIEEPIILSYSDASRSNQNLLWLILSFIATNCFFFFFILE